MFGRNYEIDMLFDKLKQIKGFVFHTDGVLAASGIWVTSSGEYLRMFDSRDGYALQLAIQEKYPVAIVNSNMASDVTAWLDGMGLNDMYTMIDDKKSFFQDWLSQNELDADRVLYMGGDIQDLAGMKSVGFPTCPADAAEEVKAIATYISFRNGGAGAVRDVIEKVMKLQDKWKYEVRR